MIWVLLPLLMDRRDNKTVGDEEGRKAKRSPHFDMRNDVYANGKDLYQGTQYTNDMDRKTLCICFAKDFNLRNETSR